LVAVSISAIVTGPLPKEFDVRYSAEELRRHFPNIAVVLATSDRKHLGEVDYGSAFDRVVAVDDAGALPTLKWDDATPNNVNRQIATVSEALKHVTTDLCIRLRSDCTLMSDDALARWEQAQTVPRGDHAVGQQRLLVSSIFTINPRFDERMAYHVGDTFQLGLTQDLKKYFGAPRMPISVATWYERESYSADATRRERAFRSRFAVEQWLCLHYLVEDEARFPIRVHNDLDEATLAAFEERLIADFVVVHPRDMQLRMPRFAPMLNSSYFNALCYSTTDWAELAQRLRGERPHIAARAYWPTAHRHKIRLVRAVNSRIARFVGGKLPRRLRQRVLGNSAPVEG
jgi:hypothetical protein